MKNRSVVCVPRGELSVYAAVLLILLAVGACKRGENATSRPAKSSEPVVYTTFYPTTYLTQRIAGPLVRVVNPCPPDADPAFWMPDDATIAAYQQADLIIINGAEFEKWVARASLPMSKLVDTTLPLKNELITLKDAVTHSHGPQGKHTHSGLDGHTWLDPINAKRQAMKIKEALADAFSSHAETFDHNYASLAVDLDKLDARLRALSTKIGQQPLFANHPAWNYVARRYGWKLTTFHLDPEEMPDDETMEKIREAIGVQPARFILWEAQPAREIEVRFLKECGLTSILYAPGETLAPAEAKAGQDFLTVMNSNIDRLEKALGS